LEQTAGPMSMDLALAYSSYCSSLTFSTTTPYDDLLKYSTKALAILTSNIKYSKPTDIVDVLLHLCEVLVRKKDLIEAEKFAIKANELAKESNDKEGFYLSSNRIAVVLSLRQDLVKAEIQYQTVVENAKELHGEKHLETAVQMYYLGDIYLRRKKYPECEQTLRKAIAILLDAKVKSLALAEMYYVLGTCLNLQNNIDEALDYHKQSIDIATTLGDTTGLVVMNQLSYALTCDTAKRYEEGLPYLREAHNFYMDKFGPWDNGTKKSMNLLIKFLAALDKKPELEEWEAKYSSLYVKPQKLRKRFI